MISPLKMYWIDWGVPVGISEFNRDRKLFNRVDRSEMSNKKKY